MQRQSSRLLIVLLASTLLVVDSALADPSPFTRQTTRQLSYLVGSRVARAELAAAALKESDREWETKRKRDGGFEGWYHVDLQNTSDDDFPVEIHADGYQPLVGAEYSIGKTYVGLSIGYLGVDADFRPDSSLVGFVPTEGVNADIFTVAPYLAYAFSEHFFASLIAGYQAQDWDNFEFLPNDLSSDGAFYDVNLNLIGALGEDRSVEVKSNVGFTHEITKASRVSEDHDFTTTAGLDLTLPMETVSPYARAWYELSFEDNSTPEEHTGFAGIGLRVAFSERVALDVGGWTSFANKHRRESVGEVTLRFAVP